MEITVTDERRKRMLEYVNKLVEHLKKKGVNYLGEDKLGNVVFEHKNKEKAIRGEEFYRISGIYSYKVMISEQFFKLVPMTDEMFYGSFIKTVLEYVFFPPKPKQ